MQRREFHHAFWCRCCDVATWRTSAAGDEDSSDRRPVAWPRRQIRRKSCNSRRVHAGFTRAWLHRRTEYCLRPEIRRWRYKQARPLAQELVDSRVDAIVVLATPAARAVKQATSSIPIIAIGMADPVEDELVSSLARPGGNVTGTAFLGPELVSRRLQLLKEIVPRLSRVVVLWHPRAYGERTMAGMLKEIESAAQSLGTRLQLVPAAGPDDLTSAFATMTTERADGLIVFPSPMLFSQYPRIVTFAANDHLPAMYAAREAVELGGLVSYGVNLPDLSRATAIYLDKILKGAKPAELPVQQATKFELVINLKTARALGLTITHDFLLIADEVIE